MVFAPKNVYRESRICLYHDAIEFEAIEEARESKSAGTEGQKERGSCGNEATVGPVASCVVTGA